jgi:hypothetical protein
MELIPFANLLKKSFLLFFLVILSSCNTVKWSSSGLDTEQMMADVTFLADDKLEGRTFGSKGETKAGDYIANRFKKLGLKPMGDNGTWFQSFAVKAPNPHAVEFAEDGADKSMTGRNVIGYLDHGAPYTVVLGAHYDHLGYGEFGSLYVGSPAIHNGADDNASGVAMIMELAQRLSHEKEFNYLFIAFTGEENGLWGSNYFCKHPTYDLAKVTAMINFDMVGRLHEDKLAINGTGTSPAWPQLISESNTFNFKITSEESGIGPSDYTSFYLVDIPAIHFFTGAHEDYHKPSDDVHLINSAGMGMVADMVSKLVKMIDEKEKMAFTKTKDPDPSSTPKMEVTLGVLPDYLYDGVGMRIDGVREGKPAALAGMVKGDIILKLGDQEIKDIYVYMEALSAFHKGDKAKLVALRDGKEMEFDIQF